MNAGKTDWHFSYRQHRTKRFHGNRFTLEPFFSAANMVVGVLHPTRRSMILPAELVFSLSTGINSNKWEHRKLHQ